MSEKEGDAVLREFGGTWSSIFESVLNEEVRNYFQRLDLSDDFTPFVQRGETYSGSWVMEASVVMRGTMGRAYNALRKALDLSGVAEGFVSLKDEIIKKLDLQTNQEVARTLDQVASNVQPGPAHIPPPRHSAVIDLVIDAPASNVIGASGHEVTPCSSSSCNLS